MTGRALVLGGGGVAGIGWETGVLFGLAEGGIHVADVDVVIGTSAGAAVGAQLLSGTSLASLYDRIVFPEGPSTEIVAELDLEKTANDLAALLSAHEPGPELRAAIGRWALAAGTPPERARRAVIEARLPSHGWPERDLRIVVVDAATGEDRVITRDDGVALVDAVAASCAVPGVWPPVTIDGRRYIDGGIRTTTNIDLAEGHDTVVVLAPLDGFLPVERNVSARLAEMEKTSTIFTVTPDETALAAIGTNSLDPATARPAAQAGREQARALVDEMRSLWEP